MCPRLRTPITIACGRLRCTLIIAALAFLPAELTAQTAPSVTVSPTSGGAGGTVTATIANGPGNAADYIGLYPAGASSTSSNRLAYQFLNGLLTAPTSGVSGAALTVTLPTASGTYDVRFFATTRSPCSQRARRSPSRP